ncbi:hypothetical protein, partial [Cronobacter turicensis]|uniref:hypothetical protein n=1 Tax=Cronobacter turicensis TaxID=413502 RepID=UPI003D16006E
GNCQASIKEPLSTAEGFLLFSAPEKTDTATWPLAFHLFHRLFHSLPPYSVLLRQPVSDKRSDLCRIVNIDYR